MCVGTFFGLCEGIRIVGFKVTGFLEVEIHVHRDPRTMIVSLIEVAWLIEIFLKCAFCVTNRRWIRA